MHFAGAEQPALTVINLNKYTPRIQVESMDTGAFLQVKDVVDDLLTKKKHEEAIIEVKASKLDAYYKSKLLEYIEQKSQGVSSTRKDSISMEQPCTKHGKCYSTRYDCPVCWP